MADGDASWTIENYPETEAGESTALDLNWQQTETLAQMKDLVAYVVDNHKGRDAWHWEPIV